MTLPSSLAQRLRLPVIAAPMFIVSTPGLVIAQCQSGIVGSFPALNARPQSQLDEWLCRIRAALAQWDRAHPEQPAAPFAVNLIVHKSNDRLQADLQQCIRHEVPIVITSLGARPEVNQAVQAYGGITLHDVIDDRFARKAVEKGASGLIAVAAGAGGHAGTTSPFALIQEIRSWFDGPLALSGAIASGSAILAARAMGADLAYIGSAFIVADEANAADAYKQMVIESSAADVLYTNVFTGTHGNYLRPAVLAAGLDPDRLAALDPAQMSFRSGGESLAKVWRDIWSCGQGVGVIQRRCSAAQIIAALASQYAQAQQRLGNADAGGPALISKKLI